MNAAFFAVARLLLMRLKLVDKLARIGRCRPLPRYLGRSFHVRRERNKLSTLLLRHPLDFRLETGRNVKLNQMSHHLLRSSTATTSFRSSYTEVNANYYRRQALSLTYRLPKIKWLFIESPQWQLISFSSPISEGGNDETKGTPKLSVAARLLAHRYQGQAFPAQ